MKERIQRIFNKSQVKAFCEGPLYPLAVALTVLVGNLTGLEVIFNLLFVALAATSLVFTNTLRPFAVNLCTFIYQLSLENSLFYPSYSNYYASGWRLPVLLFSAILLGLFLIYFIVKNELYKGLSIKKTPLLLPLLIFSSALLLNGAFSGVWSYKNLIYAASQIIVFLFVFLILFEGMKKESADALGSYFAYVSMIIALIISVELIALYLTSDSIFVGGSINKVGVALGWGIWNLIGVSAVVLIPMIFYGMAKNKYPWLYFSVATLTWIVSVLSMSRNALIFGSLTYAACVLIFSFVGERKKIFRIIVLVGIAFAVGFALVFFDKIYALFKDFFDRGLSDNGRYALWKTAFGNFLEAPIFGKGFYGFGEADVFGAMPESCSLCPQAV